MVPRPLSADLHLLHRRVPDGVPGVVNLEEFIAERRHRDRRRFAAWVVLILALLAAFAGRDHQRHSDQVAGCERGNVTRETQRYVLGVLQDRAKVVINNPDESPQTKRAFRLQITELGQRIEDAAEVDCSEVIH